MRPDPAAPRSDAPRGPERRDGEAFKGGFNAAGGCCRRPAAPNRPSPQGNPNVPFWSGCDPLRTDIDQLRHRLHVSQRGGTGRLLLQRTPDRGRRAVWRLRLRPRRLVRHIRLRLLPVVRQSVSVPVRWRRSVSRSRASPSSWWWSPSSPAAPRWRSAAWRRRSASGSRWRWRPRRFRRFLARPAIRGASPARARGGQPIDANAWRRTASASAPDALARHGASPHAADGDAPTAVRARGTYGTRIPSRCRALTGLANRLKWSQANLALTGCVAMRHIAVRIADPGGEIRIPPVPLPVGRRLLSNGAVRRFLFPDADRAAEALRGRSGVPTPDADAARLRQAASRITQKRQKKGVGRPPTSDPWLPQRAHGQPCSTPACAFAHCRAECHGR